MTDEDMPVEEPATPQHIHKVRLSFNPLKWVHVTEGELHDHRTWGSLVELFTGEKEAKPAKTAAPAPTKE
jgi:hypothetical protein